MEYISPNQLEELTEEEDLKKHLPSEMNFGFVEDLSKQSLTDTRTIINNYVKDNFKSKRQSYFKITKVKNHSHLPDGYFYEIHDGGKGVSFSQLILSKFEEEDTKSVIVKIKERYVFILRKIADIETNYMSINNLTEIQKELLLDYDKKKYMDKTKKPDMEVVFSDKLTFFVISQGLLIASLITLAIASFLRFGYYSVESPHQEYQNYSIMPIMEIEGISPSENSRVLKIQYNHGRWTLEREVIDSDGETSTIVDDIIDVNSNFRTEENNAHWENRDGS